LRRGPGSRAGRPDGRGRARGHGPAARPGCRGRRAPADAAPARGGCPRARRRPPGGGPRRRPGVRPGARGRRGAAPSGPSPRRAGGRRDGPVPGPAVLVLPAQAGPAPDDRGEHRRPVPRGGGAERLGAHRDGARAVRDHLRRQLRRARHRGASQGLLGSELMTALTIERDIQARRLPARAPWLVGPGALPASPAVGSPGSGPSVPAVVALAVVLYAVTLYVLSRAVEGPRRATDRLAGIAVTSAFGLAMIPLVSLVWIVVSRGL